MKHFHEILALHLNVMVLYERALPFYGRDNCSYSFASGLMTDSRSFSASSASFSILDTKTLTVGMSWINPMTWPAVQTCEMG